MKPSKVLAFAAQRNSRAWRRFQLLPTRPSMDPNQPPYYLIDCQGERGDGVVFSVTAAVDKVRYDLLTGPQSIEAARGLLNKGIQQLLTYTGCPCKEGVPCDTHKAGEA